MKTINLQFLQTELNRVSDWIRFSDQKSAFLSVYYTAILGVIISQKKSIINNFMTFNSCKLCFYYIIIGCIIISFIIGIIFLFLSVFPRLKNSFTDKSLFYFGHISKMKPLDYLENMKELTEDEAKRQMAEQIYTNSFIADIKMKNVQNSIRFLGILILLLMTSILF